MKEIPVKDADKSLLDELYAALEKQAPLFGRGNFTSITSELSIREYRFREIIFSEDLCEKSLGVVVEGRAVAKKKRSDSEVVMNSFVQGDIFGAAALYTDSQRYTSEISAASKRVRVLFIPQKRMTRFFSENSDSAIAYITILSNKIRYLNDKIDSFTSPNAFTKLCRYLCENNSTAGISMQTLAKVLNMSRMTLYRNLDILVNCGAVKRTEKGIVVVNRSKLCE